MNKHFFIILGFSFTLFIGNAYASPNIILMLDKKEYEIGETIKIEGNVNFEGQQLSQNRKVSLEVVNPNGEVVFVEDIPYLNFYDEFFTEKSDPSGIYTIYVYYGLKTAPHNLRNTQFSSDVSFTVLEKSESRYGPEHENSDYELHSLSYIQFGVVAFGIFCFVMIMGGCIRYRDQFQHIRRGLKAKMVFRTIVFFGFFVLGLYLALLGDVFSNVLGLIFTFIGLSILLSTRFVKPIQRQV